MFWGIRKIHIYLLFNNDAKNTAKMKASGLKAILLDLDFFVVVVVVGALVVVVAIVVVVAVVVVVVVVVEEVLE